MSEIAGTGSAAAKMDGIYRRQRFVYDATRRYYLLGRDRLIEGLALRDGGTALEVGCGTARNLIVAARRYPGGRLHGLDISEAMLSTARASLARRGLEAQVALAAADATAFDPQALFGRDRFDRVFISYSLSMIPDWEAVVRQAANCVAPRGSLHIVDFGDFAAYPALFRQLQLGWLRRFSVTPIAAFESRIAALAGDLGFDAAMDRLYGGYAIRACLTPRRQA